MRQPMTKLKNSGINKIYLSDNLKVLRDIKSESIDLIYIDPPFNTGKIQKYTRVSTKQSPSGDRVGFGGKFYRTAKKGSIEYNDCHWSYKGFITPSLQEAYRVLKPTGSLFFHIDYREAHYCKIILDEIFGRLCFQNEIIWTWDYGARSKKKWSAKHNNIFWYTKHPKHYTFNFDAMERIPYMAPGLVTKEKAARGKTLTDTWWHTIVPTNGKERTGYPTQKPLGVLKRIVSVHSSPGDIVLDFFAGCFDETTEVLTGNGWKLFEDVSRYDTICSLNPKDHSIEYVNFCKKIKYKYAGKMHSIQGRSIDLLVTPNHNLYAKEARQKDYELHTVSAFRYYSFNQLLSGKWKEPKTYDLNWLRFLGFWLGDGYKQTRNAKNRGYVVGFHLVKQTSVEYICKVLRALGVKYSKYTEKTGHTRVVVRGKLIYDKLNGNTYTKRIPEFVFTLSAECAKAILDGYLHADGTVTYQGGKNYYSCNKELLGDFQRIVLHAGYSSTLSGRTRTANTKLNGRSINCSRKQYTLYTHKAHKELRLTQKNIEKIDYDGYVYDVTLNTNHVLYVRRNGKCCWSGNSGTTGEAAAILGRQFILVDNHKEAVKISAERLKKYKPKCIGFTPRLAKK